MDHIKHLCLKVTPNFNYYPAQLDQAERDTLLYQLPSVIKLESKFYQTESGTLPETDKTEEEPEISTALIQRRAYDCPICEKTMYFSLAEIFKHRKVCVVNK